MIELIVPELGGGLLVGAPFADDIPDFVDPTPGGAVGAAGTLPLAPSPEAIGYAAFVDRITSDPALRDLVAFRTWSGAIGDDVEVGPAPWVRLSPRGKREEPWGLHKVLVVIEVHVDLLTPGLAVADQMNLWSAVRAAFSTPAARAALRAARVVRVVVDVPPFGARPSLPAGEPGIPGTITGLGAIEVQVERPR